MSGTAIGITIYGVQGWLCVLLWVGMAVGVPWWCYRFGKQVGRERVLDEQADAEHAAWMREHSRDL